MKNLIFRKLSDNLCASYIKPYLQVTNRPTLAFVYKCEGQTYLK
jgi:hypothetical protein